MLASLLLMFSVMPEPPDTVVVCPKEFISALAPWLNYREAQGHRIEILPNTKSPEQLRAEIREIGKSGTLKFVLLVGDADPRAQYDPSLAKVSIPAHKAPAKVNVKWGSDPEIGTDNWYADLDDDQIPELAIGRLTADSREELARVVRKIIDYETKADFGPWRRQVNLIAGVGGFGAMADSVLESATKKFLTDGIPSAYQTSMTYGSWRSPYCPDPRRFHETTVERFNEGCLFWVYMGHGQKTFLDQIRVPGSAYHILDVDDVQKLNPQGRSPIAVLLSCYAGAYDSPHDCLAEELLRSTGGPVAVLCGSRVTMPYAMAVLGNELIGDYFGEQSETLGEAVLSAKRRMMSPPPDSPNTTSNRELLDALAKVISPDPDLLEDERREHLLLFNLLGDPMLKLARPAKIKIETSKDVYAGSPLEVSLDAPVAGECLIELVSRRDRLKDTPPVREYYDGRDRILASYDEVYKKANDALWSVHRVRCEPGEFTITFDVPEEVRGNCHVRAFVQGEREFAIGSADVFVRKPVMTAAGGE